MRLEIYLDRNEEILKEIGERIYIGIDELAGRVELPSDMLRGIVDELEREYLVARTKSGKYALASTMGLFRGTIDCKRGGFAFLRTPENVEDIFLSPSHKGGAFDGEDVLVRLLKRQSGGGHLEGKVVKVLSPLPVEVVGTVQARNGTVFVANDTPGSDDVYIPKRSRRGAKNGQKVVARVTQRAFRGKSAEGEIIEILGKAGDAGVDILAYARRFGLVSEFPDACRRQAEALTAEQTAMEGRTDLRDRMVFTIDGADAKDLDDAVSLRILENGNYELGVHIADVSHYVREGSPLDKEALRRGTSVYLVDRVVPMLPKELSNGLCSLNAGEDKLTLSCMMEIDRRGELVAQKLENTMIRSSYRLTYEGVNRLLAGDTEECGRYAEIKDTLAEMNKLAKTLRARRFEKGSIDFNIDEAQILLDGKGIPKAVTVRKRGDAERMIEEFMLLANITVAQQYYYMELPFLYRVHEQPDAQRMKELAVFLGNFGIHLKGFQNVHPHAIQDVLTQAEGRPEEIIVNTVTLRALKKARYAVQPISHFGLAADQYCHFTSPIRRYPDLQVHRIVKRLIGGKMDDGYIRHLETVLPEIATQTSARERNAIEAERAVQDLKMTEYMARYIGEEFPAVISGVTNFGLFAELDNTIEGMIPLACMNDDYYVYHEKEYCVIGEHTKRRITLGDKVRIKVAAADVAVAKIEFTFADI